MAIKHHGSDHTLVLEPYSSLFNEHRDQLALKMQAHDLIGSTNQLLSYKNSWDTWLTSQGFEFFLDLLTIWAFIKLINSWVCPEAAYQCPDAVAYTARVLAEYNHCFVSYQPWYNGHCYYWIAIRYMGKEIENEKWW